MEKSSLIEARDEFLKLLPIIPIWLTILSACNLYTKYIVYDVNIFLYLDLQEILTLFIDDLLYFLIISNGLLYIFDSSFDRDKTEFSSWRIKIPRWLSIIFHLFVAIIPTLLFGYLAVLIFINNTVLKSILNVIASILAVNVALNISKKVSLFLKEKFEKPVYMVYRYYMFSLIVIASWAYGRALLNLSPDTSNSKYKFAGSNIVTSSQSINIDNYHILIGRTKNYTFIYTAEDNCTSVIPNSDIKSFYIKKKSFIF